MTFETLLAKRYIFAQKRHSLLTLSSIVVAVTLMTFLFCAFTTYLNCIAKGAPYHFKFEGGTSELVEYINDYPDVKGAFSEQLSDGTYDIRVFFKKNILDTFDLIEDIQAIQEKEPDRLKLDPHKFSYTNNDIRIMLEMIDERSKANMSQIFAMFYVIILFIAFALRLIIDTSFEVSAKEREKQFGVLQSIGASPKQIVGIITFEGLLLSVAGIPIGLILGIGLTFLAFRFIASTELFDTFVSDPKYIADMGVSVKPLVILICAVTCLVWVLFSAYGTGMRIIKKSPIQAITERSNTIKKVRKGSLWGLLFGWAGKMATRNNHRQPKRYIITILALTLSITLFTAFNLVLNTAGRIVEKTFDSLGADVMLDTDISEYEDAVKLADRIENSGYFKNCGFSLGFLFNSETIRKNDQQRIGSIEYVTRSQYETSMLLNGIKPSVSYDDLLSSGKYLMIDYTDDIFPEGDSISGEAVTYSLTDEEEYNREKTKEDKPGLYSKSIYNDKFYKRENRDFDMVIAERIPVSSLVIGVRGAVFMAPIETYLNETKDILGEIRYGISFTMNYKDYKLHNRAVNWLDSDLNAQNRIEGFDNGSYYYDDFYNERHRSDTMIAAVKYGLLFVSILIAAIALVNLINIISTGIVNRKSELASMQCLGMTPKQLYGMTFIECLQYIFCSLVGSVLLCSIIIFGVRKMITSVFFDADISNSTALSSMMVRYTEPLPTILIASIAALAAALITSYFPLRRMQKESLVDQIRSIE